MVITQNGKPAAVVLSPEEFENIKYAEQFMNSENQGFADINSGDVFDSEQLQKELKKQRTAGKSG